MQKFPVGADKKISAAAFKILVFGSVCAFLAAIAAMLFILIPDPAVGRNAANTLLNLALRSIVITTATAMICDIIHNRKNK